MGFLNLSGKYRSLIISIAVLVVLILSFLLFTIYSVVQTAKNNQIMDATHEVAINTQSTLKDLFDLDRSKNEDITSPHMKTVITRIRGTVNETNQVFKGLKTGEPINYEGREGIVLPVVTGENRQLLDKIEAEWVELEQVLQNYLKEVDDITIDSSKSLYLASTKAAVASVVMEDDMEKLLHKLHEDADRTTTIVTGVEIAGIVVLIVYFALFLSVFVRRLREADDEALAAHQETEEIMKTVGTGLFLLDKDLKVGNQFSAALVGIMGTDRLAGESLSSVLRNRISDKDLQTTEEFIEQLYNPRVKEKLVNSLNPLNKVLFNDGKGMGESRYLDFVFSRVYDGGDIARILVNVNDVSDAVKLEQRLEKERAQNDRQIEMLTTILNVSPRIINEFIANTGNRIDKMNNTLKNPGSSQFELEGKLKSIYREMHSLKGEASALKLHSFTKIASEAEDKLQALQNQGKLSGNDFLPLTVHLDELLNLSNAISTLGERINSAAANVAASATRNHEEVPEPTELPPSTAKPMDAKEELGDFLVDFGKNIADRQGKSIAIDISRMAGTVIPKKLSIAVKEVCVQLLRNAIVHGIADSKTRESNGKNPVGKVRIIFEDKVGENQDHFMFVVEDDGQGIDYDAIRKKLLESGRYPADKVQSFTNPQLLNTLFSSGFSTKATADEDGGRGVGLDIVKDRVQEYGGKIHVQSEKGRFSRFIVKLPISHD